jgi:hypothetical protein
MPAFVAASLPGFAWLAAGVPATPGVLGGPPGTAVLDVRGAIATAFGLPADLPVCRAFDPSSATGSARQSPQAQPAQASPQAVPRYRVESILDGEGALAGWNLTASAGATSLRIALPPESSVRGPVDGRIAVAMDDGSRSQVRVIDPAGACGELAIESRDVVRSAVLTDAGDSIVYHAVGRADRADKGIWRQSLGRGKATQQVLPAVRIGDPLLDEIGPVWTTGLRVSEDGARLAVESCGAEACRVRIADLGSGSRPSGDSFPGMLVGLDDQQLLTLRDCDGLSCDLVSTALATRAERRLATDVASASSLVLDGRLFAVAALQLDGRPSLVAIDAAAGKTWVAAESVLAEGFGPEAWASVRLVPAGGTSDAGIEAPSGWVGVVAGPKVGLMTLDTRRILAGRALEAVR